MSDVVIMAQAGPSSRAAGETKILLTFEDSVCAFCSVVLSIGKGIMMQDCLHIFCKNCLSTWIENSPSVDVGCPIGCGGKLYLVEIKALMGVRGYERLEKKWYKNAIENMPNIFKCQTPRCKGWCQFGEGSKVYNCPLCNQSNCIGCQAIHGDFTCEEYQAEKQKCLSSGAKNPEKQLRALVQKRNHGNGIEQMIAIVGSSTNGNIGDENGNSPGTYDSVMNSIAQQRLLTSKKVFECIICYSDVPAGHGVILQECYHMFCKRCLISHVEHNTDAEVRCPQPNCTSFILPREIQALLPQEVLDKVTKRSWNLVESVIVSKFHCLTANCDGFCELVGNVIAFQCPLCQKTNCISCNAIHEGVTCDDYKNRRVQNQNDIKSVKALENLVATGKAMRCTKCTAVVQKEVGCDAILCVMCKTELCWATKGPRWGPNGRGDTSGGCRCRVNGVPCHPKCGNCH